MAAPVIAVQRRDLVVIGTSAGGVEALPKLLSQLPGTFDASVVIVQHLGPRDQPMLVHILQRAATLPVTWAEQGDRIQRGHVYVAPPDTHLTIHEAHLRLASGPRENFARPSIDRLFRSAAAHYGSRAIGVLLTGMMGDGISGLRAIDESGGRTIVQDPSDAMYSELPSRALAEVKPTLTLPLDQIGRALVALSAEPANGAQVPVAVALEAEIDRLGPVSPREMDQLGDRVQQMCPECGGPLWKITGEERWRCYLGHAVHASALLDATDDQLEAALWSAVRALHERAATWEALAHEAKIANRDRVASDYTVRAREAREQGELARKFMLDLLRRPR
ncbi:MAG: chemotaxis protein CheB [Deltaproteobacteria bacterium]|nr:chemotaxis protein CheB [Deltaproteobacteria bacterium]